MYLKSIEVHGFKSFANKINFEFKKGITGIVGPNGSGKSNVGDAVRWVLGEQSAKQLRGAKMEDVIFSGTENRKPLGFAYVAITLDNSDHSLPIEYDEVTVARRVYRSGESEYLINGSTCRLKDVTSLFLDTGIGKEGYSIIGQGQVDKILNGKPEEKRELFDEAAGIVKYKKNKAATEKSLEAERQNLSRVNDILSELTNQIGPLEKQSEVAKKYLSFKEELKELDINVFLLENQRIKDLAKDLEEKISIVNGNMSDLNNQYEEIKAEYDKLEKEIEIYTEKIENLKNEIHSFQLTKQEDLSNVKLLKEQINSALINEEHIKNRISRINSDLEAKAVKKNEYAEEKRTLDEQMDNADETQDNLKSTADNIGNEIKQLNEEIEKNKADIFQYINEGSSVKAKVGRYDAMLENISLRKTQLNQRFLQYKSDDQLNHEIIDNFSLNLSEVSTKIENNNKEYIENESLLSDNQKTASSNREQINVASQEFNKAKARLESLKNITERYDGYGNSIKRVMEQKDKIPGILGVVADIITVNKQYEVAVETALGGSIQNIVTDNESTAKGLIDFLKKNRFGRATFLPLTSVANRNSFTRKDALNEKGVIGLGSQLVETKERFKPIVENLLGRIVVVDGIDNALALARKFQYSLRIVTLEGELLNPGGAMTGGAFKNSSNLLGRKRELEELEELVVKYSNDMKMYMQIDIELKDKRESIKEKLNFLSKERQELFVEQNTASMKLAQANSKLKELENNFNAIKRENSELENQIEEINKNKNELLDGNKEFDKKREDCEGTIKTLEEKLKVKRSEEKKAIDDVNNFALSFNTLKQQDDFIISNIRRIRNEEAELNRELSEIKSKINESSDEINKINSDIDKINLRILSKDNEISTKEELLTELINNKNQIASSHKEFFSKRESLNEEIALLDKSLFRLNAQKDKTNDQIEQLNNYMWEEYEITYNNALAYRNEQLNDLSTMKRQLLDVKNKIKGLGDVNVNAIEDYKVVSERHDFLQGQRDDIIEAERNLIQIIEELDIAMRNQFTEKFAEIRTMFDKVFKDLFGGGKSNLELVEGEDVLEAGIRIIAQPPGKKLQNMMQLSGGEKALTAIALLFAIQSLKPSPFCLLDEIEAALDDSNVKRYAQYLHKLTKDTQFIVITHRKGTMEAADVLYGITMQEKGVSTLVSVNLIENQLSN